VSIEDSPAVAANRAWTDHSTRRMDLRHAIDRLPEGQRAALDLVFYHDLSLSDVAAILGVPAGTVKSRLHRAKATLRDVLAGSEAEDV
jgi:RNA polymerase sigma-70 factor (ECF subfamily)